MKKILLILVSMVLAMHFSFAASYQLFTSSCTTNPTNTTCTLQYHVYNVTNAPVVIMISGGYWNISSVSLPSGCTQKQFIDDVDGYSTAYAAVCTQSSGAFSVTATASRPGTYISEAAYVLTPGSYTFTTNAATTTSGTLSMSHPLGIFTFVAGASGNGLLQGESGTIDVSDSDSAVWHQPGNSTTISESTPSPPLTMAYVVVS